MESAATISENEQRARSACKDWGWTFCTMSDDDTQFNYIAPGIMSFGPLWFEVERIEEQYKVRRLLDLLPELPAGGYVTGTGIDNLAISWKRALSDAEAAQAAEVFKRALVA